jgi:hypothetical protein
MFERTWQLMFPGRATRVRRRQGNLTLMKVMGSISVQLLGKKSTKNNHLMYTIFQHSQRSSCFPTKHFYNRTELAKNEPIITKYKQTVANYHKFIRESRKVSDAGTINFKR